MKTQWNIDELEAHFMLLPPEVEWLDPEAKDSNRLGQAIMLKYFQYEGRFPEESRDVPADILDFIAQQLEIDAAAVERYQWDGRTARNHKRAIRELHGFQSVTVDDQTELRDWLMAEALPDEHRLHHLAQLAYEDQRGRLNRKVRLRRVIRPIF